MKKYLILYFDRDSEIVAYPRIVSATTTLTELLNSKQSLFPPVLNDLVKRYGQITVRIYSLTFDNMLIEKTFTE